MCSDNKTEWRRPADTSCSGLVPSYKARSLFFFSLNISISFLLVFFSVWFLHINLGNKIEPKLPDDGYYQASIPYRVSLQGGDGDSLNFISRLYDHFAFLPHYTKGVPKLNYCKKTENGSPWYWWLVGGKSINYRWEKKDNLTHFLYLVANPVGWGLSFLGVLLAGLVFASSLIFKPVVSRETQLISSTLLFTWLFYMGIFGSLGRVMYLYHYFIPLILGWIMLCLLSSQVAHIGSMPLTSARRQAMLVSFAFLQLLSFLIFSPFTYARGISDKGVSSRNWLAVWDIRCAGCESENPLARPIGDPKTSVNSNISISGLRAIETYQGWGEPKMDRSVTDDVLAVAGTTYKSGIGVHAESRVVFATNKGFKRFSAKAALPDYLISRSQGSVVFKVIGDGRELWRSSRITAGIPPESVNLDISRFDRITLEADDAGDGITSDHALWLEPRFE